MEQAKHSDHKFSKGFHELAKYIGDYRVSKYIILINVYRNNNQMGTPLPDLVHLESL